MLQRKSLPQLPAPRDILPAENSWLHPSVYQPVLSYGSTGSARATRGYQCMNFLT